MWKHLLKVTRSVITMPLIIHFGISLLFGYLLRFFSLKYTVYLHDDQIVTGKWYWLGFMSVQILSSWHGQFFVKSAMNKLQSNTMMKLEEILTKKILNVNWNDLAILEKEGLSNLKTKLLWPYTNLVVAFIQMIMVTVVPFSFAILFIAEQSLELAVLYLTVVPLLIWYTESPKREIDTWIDLWNIYDRIQDSLVKKAIHCDSNSALIANQVVVKEMQKLNSSRNNTSNKQSFISYVSLTLISFIGVFFFLEEIKDGSVLTLLITEFGVLSSNISSFFNLNTQFMSAKKEFDIVQQKLFSKSKQPVYQQIHIKNSITLRTFEFERYGFSIKLDPSLSLKFELGKVYRLHGKKGSGKSTFFDNIAGVLGHSVLEIDDKLVDHGFKHLSEKRLYHRQKPRLARKTSIYYLVSDILNPNEEISLEVERNVYKALRICKCDFVNFESNLNSNIRNGHKKSIYDKEVGFSGGQADVISLASTIYQILVGDFQIALFDEPDSSIENESVVEFMNEIIKLCKSKNILLICILHTEKAQQEVNFDQVIYFNDGQISL